MNDILMKVTVHNRDPEAATIHVLPHCWFRNFWKHNLLYTKLEIFSVSLNSLQTRSARKVFFFFITKMASNCFATTKSITSECITGQIIKKD